MSFGGFRLFFPLFFNLSLSTLFILYRGGSTKARFPEHSDLLKGLRMRKAIREHSSASSVFKSQVGFWLSAPCLVKQPSAWS